MNTTCSGIRRAISRRANELLTQKSTIDAEHHFVQDQLDIGTLLPRYDRISACALLTAQASLRTEMC